MLPSILKLFVLSYLPVAMVTIYSDIIVTLSLAERIVVW